MRCNEYIYVLSYKSLFQPSHMGNAVKEISTFKWNHIQQQPKKTYLANGYDFLNTFILYITWEKKLNIQAW